MPDISSRKGLQNHLDTFPKSFREYFGELPRLLEEDFSFDVSLAYVFARLELAHNQCLYCGIVKLHKANAELAWTAVRGFHLTRDGFREKYQTIYGAPLPPTTIEILKRAEVVRDAVLHGKGGSEGEKRNAIANVLNYAAKLNEHAEDHGGPRPCGDLRGFSGASQTLERGTSRWILKGMGFAL